MPNIASSDDFAKLTRGRMQCAMAIGILFAVTLAFVFVVAPSPVLPLVILVVATLFTVLLKWPQSSLYIVFAAICLFEEFPRHFPDSMTDQVPFFWNINTIIQIYAHVDFKAVPLNVMELVVLIAGISALVRAVLMKEVRLRIGPLFWQIFAYICFVCMGWVNGLLTGGDFKTSLMEVRPQFYLILPYLMVVNMVRNRRQIDALLWTMVVCIGIKGILYTFRRYVTLAGMPVSDQGVGSHEEAFLFDGYMLLLILLSMFQIHTRLRSVMWLMLPFVVIGNLATNRRAGTAALIIAMPILLMAAERALPKLRTRIRIFSVIMVVLFAVYYIAFKNSDSIFAQPARAIGSIIQPNSRDAASNEYRDAENKDLMATIRLSPMQGYGYGKHMLHVARIADISSLYEYWDVMTHNQILWVWMRVGTFGFITFWMMVAVLIIRACTTLRDARYNAHSKSMAAYSILVISMLMIVAGLDIYLVNMRCMLFVGYWMGILGVVVADGKDHMQETEAAL